MSEFGCHSEPRANRTSLTTASLSALIAPIRASEGTDKGYQTMRRVIFSAGLVLALLMVLQNSADAAADPIVTQADSANATIGSSVSVNVTENDTPDTLNVTGVSQAFDQNNKMIGKVQIVGGQVLYTPYTGTSPVPKVSAKH